jgi:hypothetical protein
MHFNDFLVAFNQLWEIFRVILFDALFKILFNNTQIFRYYHANGIQENICANVRNYCNVGTPAIADVQELVNWTHSNIEKETGKSLQKYSI